MSLNLKGRRPMVYFDYSATTPVNPIVLEQFMQNTIRFFANPNSVHRLGVEALQEINRATEEILKLLELTDHELIYTSGATEANNLAIKGYCLKHQEEGKHLIVSPYEHSSVVSAFRQLSDLGFDIDVIEATSDGIITVDLLKSYIREDTIFVSIGSINSETGVSQDIEAIASFLKEYPKIAFHTDATQAIGKKKIKFNDVDLVSIAAHKFYGMKGVGCLLRKKNILIESQISGGHSLSIYRSGTPATPLLLSLKDALSEIFSTFEEDLKYVTSLHEYLSSSLLNHRSIIINSTKNSVPHIFNISIIGHTSSEVQSFLSRKEIYVSTQSACSQNASFSQIIYKMTGDEERARSSIRISLSRLTTKDEVDQLVVALKELCQ